MQLSIAPLKNPNLFSTVFPSSSINFLDIVEMLDASDQIGVDTSVPPIFDCENCYGKMVPIYYVSVNGKIFEYKD